MGVITGVLQQQTELSGRIRIAVLTASVASSDDTISISEDIHKFSEVDQILGAVITGGLDAAFTSIQVEKVSATQLRIKSFNASGVAATDFTNAAVSISLLVK